MSKLNYKFTKEMVIERFIKMIHSQPEQAKPQGRPNILQMMRAKKEQGKTEWPLT